MAETCLHGPCTCPTTEGSAFCAPSCEELAGRAETELCRCGHDGCSAAGSASQDEGAEAAEA